MYYAYSQISEYTLMNWIFKVLIQNAAALLPACISNSAYYWMQRHFGGLRPVKIDPSDHLNAGLEICDVIRKNGGMVEGKTFLEIGTGRRLNMPIVFWLSGAGKIITLDKNEYLKEELVLEDIKRMTDGESSPTDKHRLTQIDKEQEISKEDSRKVGFSPEANINHPSSSAFICGQSSSSSLPLLSQCRSLSDVMKTANIQYVPNADAADLSGVGSFGYHVSLNVFEHIPSDVLTAILKKGAKNMNEGGLFVHIIDMTDHFSHSDKSLSSINFLKYSDKNWNLIAGNRYMYQNRLRVDDYETLFKEAGLEIVDIKKTIDENALAVLSNGLMVDEKYSGKPSEVLATTRIVVVARIQR